MKYFIILVKQELTTVPVGSGVVNDVVKDEFGVDAVVVNITAVVVVCVVLIMTID